MTKVLDDRLAEPFRDTEQVWFWAVGALVARRDGARSSGPSIRRPCDPDDVVRCLDRLSGQGRINQAHARVLQVWGERQLAPDAASARERGDAGLWQEAIGRLERPLREKGIVAGPCLGSGRPPLSRNPG